MRTRAAEGERLPEVDLRRPTIAHTRRKSSLTPFISFSSDCAEDKTGPQPSRYLIEANLFRHFHGTFMGSWAELKIDDFVLYGHKSVVDDVTLSIFHERDRRVRPDASGSSHDSDEGPAQLYEYAISAQRMRERLDALGFTGARACRDYEAGYAYELLSANEWRSAEEVRELKARTYDQWRRAVGRLLPQGFQSYDQEQWQNDPDA
jgi:hypothetical protein